MEERILDGRRKALKEKIEWYVELTFKISNPTIRREFLWKLNVIEKDMKELSHRVEDGSLTSTIEKLEMAIENNCKEFEESITLELLK